MPASSSIGNLNARITADAEQFVAEFKRADAAAAQSSDSISSQVDKISDSISKHFTGGRLMRSLLSGLGIGSGFAIAQKAAESIASYWKESAEAAQKIEESSAKQLEYLQQRLALDRPADISRTLLVQQQGRLQNERSQILGSVGSETTVGDDTWIKETLTNDDQKRVAEITAELQKLDLEITKIDDDAQKAATARAMAAGKSLLDEQNQQEKTLLDAYAREGKALEENTELGEAKWQTIDRLTAQGTALLREYDDVVQRGLNTDADRIQAANLHAAALEKLNEAQKDQTELDKAAMAELEEIEKTWAEAFAGIDGTVPKISDDTKEAKKDAQELGWAFESAFENAVVNGEKLSNVLEGLLQDLEKIWLRKNIMDPLEKGLSSKEGVLGTIGTLLGFAGGGRPPVGQASIVGENGPEIFIPDNAGTIVPNATSAAGGDVNYYIDARGADEARLSQLERTLVNLNASVERRAVGAVVAARRRPSAASRILRS